MEKTIELVEYSPLWNKFFNKETEVLKKLLRNNLVESYHIGSTNIEGIVARPTLDILCLVHSTDGIDLFESEFNALGLKISPALDGESFEAKRIGPEGNTICHIRILKKEDSRVLDYLDFLEYLNEEPKVAQQFEEVKKALVSKFPTNELAYNKAKEDFFSIILKNLR